jgi:carbamoyltransferase
MPYNAIDYCLKAANITLKDIDHIGFSYKPWLRISRRIPYRILKIPKSPFYSIGYIVDEVNSTGHYLSELKQLKQNSSTRIHYLEHHVTHAASVFLTSPFNESAILTMDYMGEWTSTLMGKGTGSKIEKIKEIKFPHSLGILYAAVTKYLGFQHGNDEYKVMGLASYGEPAYIDIFKDMVKLLPDGEYRMNPDYFTYWTSAGSREGFMSKKFIDACGPIRAKDQEIEKRHMDIAASLQKILEDTTLHITNYLHKKTGEKNLCIAGGVGLNCSMNSRVLQDSPFESVFVQPSAHDAGTALGAAYYIYNTMLGNDRDFVINHAYWGPEFSNEEIKAELDLDKLKYTHHQDIAKKCAELINDGKIIGWFQGRAEWGPRALGNRSILANATSNEMQDIVNKYVKHREDFRPFAPAVLKESSKDFFDFDHESPFMLFICDVKPEKRKLIPAVTHTDGTARVQTVDQKYNKLFYDVIKNFGKISGIPIVLNTSFNVAGEPVVTSPKEAIRCFFSTGIDCLIMGNYLVEKDDSTT